MRKGRGVRTLSQKFVWLSVLVLAPLITSQERPQIDSSLLDLAAMRPTADALVVVDLPTLNEGQLDELMELTRDLDSELAAIAQQSRALLRAFKSELGYYGDKAGAGLIPFSLRVFAIVLDATRCPTPFSSPWMRQ
jgi:transposase